MLRVCGAFSVLWAGTSAEPGRIPSSTIQEWAAGIREPPVVGCEAGSLIVRPPKAKAARSNRVGSVNLFNDRYLPAT
jgi:hypothetical protein